MWLEAESAKEELRIQIRLDGASRCSILTINRQNWKNVTATVKATTPLRAACIPQGRTNVVIKKHDLMFLPRA